MGTSISNYLLYAIVYSPFYVHIHILCFVYVQVHACVLMQLDCVRVEPDSMVYYRKMLYCHASQESSFSEKGLKKTSG